MSDDSLHQHLDLDPDLKAPELAASADWVRELEQRVQRLEKEAPAPGARFVTHDDLEARLAATHSIAPSAVATRLCPNCGSPAHKSC